MSIGSRLDELLGRAVLLVEQVVAPGPRAARLRARLVWHKPGQARLHVRTADLEAFASCMLGRRWTYVGPANNIACPGRVPLPASYIEALALWKRSGSGPAPSLAVVMAGLCRAGLIPQGCYFIV